MNNDQVHRFVRYAEAYSTLQSSSLDDDQAIQALSGLLRKWAAEHTEEGAKIASLESARLLESTDETDAEAVATQIERLFLLRWVEGKMPLCVAYGEWAKQALEAARSVPVTLSKAAIALELGDGEILYEGESVELVAVMLRGPREVDVAEQWVTVQAWTETEQWCAPMWRTCRLRELAVPPVRGDGETEEFVEVLGKVSVVALAALRAETRPMSEKEMAFRRHVGRVITQSMFSVGESGESWNVADKRDLLQAAQWFTAMLQNRSAKDAVRRWNRKVRRSHEVEHSVALAVLEWVPEWVLCGLPQVVVDHRLCASLIATSIPLEVAELVEPPWDAFLVSIPAGLLCDQEVPVTVQMSRGQCLWGGDADYPNWDPGKNLRITVSNPADGILQQISGDLAELASYEEPIKYDDLSPPDVDRVHHERLVRCAARLVFGVCLELQNRQIGAPPIKARKDSRNNRGLPRAWSFRLARDVVVDCREYVRRFITGAAKKIASVQGMVRGHWKNQPCGSGATARKFIHIEPYWRGPEDAPIAVRSHILKGPKNDSGNEGGPVAAE